MKRICALLLAAVLICSVPLFVTAETGNVASVDGTPYATFVEAVTAAQGGSGKIELLRSLTVSDLAAVTVSGNLELDGKGFTLLFDRDYASNLFNVKAGGFLTLKNLNIRGSEVNRGWSVTYTIRTENGYAYENIVPTIPANAVPVSGNIIANAGSVVLENCSIRDMLKTSKSFLNGAGNVTLRDTEICRNVSRSVTFMSISGGNTSMQNFVFEDNCGANNCGMMGISGVKSFLIDSSSFSRNVMTTNGGAFSVANAQHFRIRNSTFTGNATGNDGGVCQVKYSSKDETLDFSFYVEDCDFEGNIGLAQGNQSLGGTFWIDATPSYNKAVDIAFRRCRFVGNSASAGGALDLSTAASKTLVEECEFVGNHASGGGAICFVNPARNVTIKSSSFFDNSAKYGGAIRGASELNLVLSACTLKGNKASNTGGGMYFKQNENVLLCDGTVVTENEANIGGGTYIYSNGMCVTFQMEEGCYFANNIASSAGDDIYAIRGTTLILPPADSMGAVTESGMPVNGWYRDYSNNRCKLGVSKDFDLVNWNISDTTAALILKASWRGKTVNCTYTWEDGENQDGKRQEFELSAVAIDSSGTVVDKKSILASSAVASGACQFLNLPLTEADGTPLTYAITADLPEGYILETGGNAEDGFFATVKHVPEIISGAVEVQWYDNGNRQGKRPMTLAITLFKDAVPVGTQKIENTGTADRSIVDFGDLPKYEEGREIVYSLSETEMPFYLTEIRGNVIINAVDLLKDAEKTAAPDDKDSEVGGDGIPDYTQVAFVFEQPKNGQLEGKTVQVFTLDEQGGSYRGTVTPETVQVNAEDFFFFEKWIKNNGTESVDPFSAQEARGGETVVYTACVTENPATGDGMLLSVILLLVSGSAFWMVWKRKKADVRN